MYPALIIPGPGTYQNLQGHQQLAVEEWLAYCQAGLAGVGGSKVGLWCYGDHAEGSTYIASVAARRLVPDLDDSWDYVVAYDLMKLIRDSWSANQVSRGNSNDYDLYVEAAGFESSVERLWSLKLLWIDDLYDEDDLEFWRKHVHMPVMERVKNGLPTVIATNMTPADHRLDGLEKVIKTWFVTCYAER